MQDRFFTHIPARHFRCCARRAALSAITAHTQQSNKSPCANPSNQIYKTLYLTNAVQLNNANEILVAIRNMVDPCIKIYLVAAQNAIVMNAPQDQIAIAEKLIQDLDRPKKTYRLIFTVTDFDGANKTGTRHYALIVASGQRVTLKQGSKVLSSPASSSKTRAAVKPRTPISMSHEFRCHGASLRRGLELLSKVEQSSVGQEPSEIGPHDPIVHQTVIEGVTMLALDKPLVLGSLDLPDSNKRTEISVVAEALP